MEALFRADLRGVRVHVNGLPTALGARAFAYANEIHLAPGEYQPETAEGWRVLGHELAHVLQQRQGRVPALERLGGSVAPLRVHDPVLEREAEQAGSLAAAWFRTGQTPSRRLPAATGAPQASPTYVIQCLMTVDEFKAATRVAVGTRDKISAIDNDLKSVSDIDIANAADRRTLRDYPQIQVRMNKLLTSCNSFKSMYPTSERIGGVDKLIREVTLEQGYIKAMVGVYQEKDELAKWDRLEAAQEAYLKASRQDGFKRKNCEQEINDQLDVYNGRLSADKQLGSDVITKDFDSLRELANKDVPSIIRQVILETTAATNVHQLDFASNRPGATYNLKTTGGQNKYTLNHAMIQQHGKPFRLGSLLHELTHISIAEIFKNTFIMLAIKKTATDDEIMTLATTRKGSLTSLQKIVTGATDLPEWQRTELNLKANYPSGPIFQGYVDMIKRKDIQADMPMNVRLNNLIKTKGLAGELVEYDTVVNQMLLWTFLWHIEPSHPVVIKLTEMVKGAYNHRLSGRAAPPVVIARPTNTTPSKPGLIGASRSAIPTPQPGTTVINF